MHSSQRAYSLYELLITLGLFALVMTLGLPSFGKMVANHRMRVEIDTLFHAIHLARKESVVRRRVVTICPTRDQQNCEPTMDWSVGWMMFVNAERKNADRRDPGEPVLRHSKPDMSIRVSANRRSFSLRSTVLRATNGTVVFCDTANRVPPRALVISYTGRPRVASKNSRGEPYNCAH